MSAPALLSVVTLGARDLPTLRDFYAKLGFPVVVDLDDFVAFQTRGAVFTLYALESLAKDARVEPATPQPGHLDMSLAINVDRREQVDEALEAARAAGARVTQEPIDMEWGGRTTYFADPEDNYWEIAWVPPDSRMAQALREAVS